MNVNSTDTNRVISSRIAVQKQVKPKTQRYGKFKG